MKKRNLPDIIFKSLYEVADKKLKDAREIFKNAEERQRQLILTGITGKHMGIAIMYDAGKTLLSEAEEIYKYLEGK